MEHKNKDNASFQSSASEDENYWEEIEEEIFIKEKLQISYNAYLNKHTTE